MYPSKIWIVFSIQNIHKRVTTEKVSRGKENFGKPTPRIGNESQLFILKKGNPKKYAEITVKGFRRVPCENDLRTPKMYSLDDSH